MANAARVGTLHPTDARGIESRRPPPLLLGKTPSGTQEGSEECGQEAARNAERRVPGRPRVPKAPVLRVPPKKAARPALPPKTYKSDQRPQTPGLGEGEVYGNITPVKSSDPGSRQTLHYESPVCDTDVVLQPAECLTPDRLDVSDSPSPYTDPTYANIRNSDLVTENYHYYDTVRWSKRSPHSQNRDSDGASTSNDGMSSQSEGPSSVFQGQSLLDANSTSSTVNASQSQGRSFVQGGQEPVAELSASFDPYFGHDKVIGLTADNFHNFIPNKDLVMVMFYDPFDPKTSAPKDNFIKAVRKKGSENFAAVDCDREPDLCTSINVNVLPLFRFYAKGKVIGTFREMTHFDDKTMIQHLDALASMGQPLVPKADPHSRESTKSKCSLAKIFGFKK